jgi:oxaloacetate decarboxylase gamma subunit
MTIMDMLSQSGVLTLLGMGIVFSFLVILIISITLAGKIIHALGWDKDVQPATGSTVQKIGNSAEITAAIGAAVNQYKKNN